MDADAESNSNSLARFRAIARAATRLLLAAAMVAGLDACKEDAATSPIVPDDGLLVVDSSYVVDFPYASAACSEVLPAGFVNSDSIPYGTVASVSVVSPACYHVQVRVQAADSQFIRTFDRYFAIYGRRDGDKNRGVEGFITWDGKDDSGRTVPRSRYLWRMQFDFGAGIIRKVRADIRLD